MRSIHTYPHPVLRRNAARVEEIDSEVRSLIDEMAEIMYLDDGIGLAAPQIGVSRRIIVVDAGEGLRGVINPEIIEQNDEFESMEEGCLSLPGIRVPVSRPRTIRVHGQDVSGEAVVLDLEGLMARVYQHEIDHLDGVLIIDRASSIQRTLVRGKLRELEKTSRSRLPG
ncbi:MAG TPA: peptide deformylase [bacterium]|nr:peptide deformylase [bacterium]